MGAIMRFTLGAICFCLLVIHYFDRDGLGVSALNFFGTKPCDKKDGTCDVTPPAPPPPKASNNFFTSGAFLSGVTIAVVGAVVYMIKRPSHSRKRIHQRLDGTVDPNLDPYDIIICLRNRLTATETELAEMKSREETFVSNADALALVPKWNSDDRALSMKSKGSKSGFSAKSQRSSKEWGRTDMTNADYVRKCKYMAKKLKESESNVKLLRTQIAIANDIKAEFDELVEQRGDMGKQIVNLAKEKSEGRRKIASLQAEVRTLRKQVDTINEQNTLLSKNNEQLGTNLKNSLRDKKLVKRQYDECNEELLLVSKKLDSIHQEKERLVVRIEELKKKVAKKPETKSQKGKDVATSTSIVDVKSIERSLMNLERSVEENLRLRKSAESLFSDNSSAYGAGDENIATIRRELEHMEEIYRVEVHRDSANETSYENSETSVTTKEVSSSDDRHRHVHDVRDGVSICCLDSTCSVCSKKDCNKLHRSCSDIHCVMPYSEMDVGKGLRPSVRRVPAVEKLADIFGNDEDYSTGIGAALLLARQTENMLARNLSPKKNKMGALNKGSLTNMLKDFTSSEESLASTGTYEMAAMTTTPKAESSNSKRESPARSRLSASSSNPTISKRSGKKMVSCYTSATSKEMTGCLNQDPELGDEDVIGDSSLARMSESAIYLYGDMDSP